RVRHVTSLLGDDARSSRVAPGSRDPTRERNREDARSKAIAGKQRHSGQFLGNLYLKGIDGTERGADASPADADRARGNRVEPETTSDQQQYRYERDDFFRHVLERAAGGKCHRYDRD